MRCHRGRASPGPPAGTALQRLPKHRQEHILLRLQLCRGSPPRDDGRRTLEASRLSVVIVFDGAVIVVAIDIDSPLSRPPGNTFRQRPNSRRFVSA